MTKTRVDTRHASRLRTVRARRIAKNRSKRLTGDIRAGIDLPIGQAPRDLLQLIPLVGSQGSGLLREMWVLVNTTTQGKQSHRSRMIPYHVLTTLQRLRQRPGNRWATLLLFIGLVCLVAQARAQQPQPPEDPEDEKQVGLWLDQGISADLSPNRSVELEFHQRLDEGASNLFEYFFQGGIAFRLRPWITVTPNYRYQRFPGNPSVAYENRLQLNITLSTTRGPWRPNLRTLIEGRFPEGRVASARIRFRPGIDYRLPLHVARPPVLVVNDEFFLVPGENSFAAGGAFTQNRFQVGVRVPVTDAFAIRPYYMLQTVNLPSGWETNEIIGLSIAIKALKKTK